MLVYSGRHIGLPLRLSYSLVFLWVCSGQADPAPTVNGWMLSGGTHKGCPYVFFFIGAINRRGGPMCPPVFMFVRGNIHRRGGVCPPEHAHVKTSTENIHGKHPRKTFMENIHGKYPSNISIISVISISSCGCIRADTSVCPYGCRIRFCFRGCYRGAPTRDARTVISVIFF